RRPDVAAEIFVAAEDEIEAAVGLARAEEVFIVRALPRFRARREHLDRREPAGTAMDRVVGREVMAMAGRPRGGGVTGGFDLRRESGELRRHRAVPRL